MIYLRVKRILSEFSLFFKRLERSDLYLGAVIILVAFLSFGLGHLSGISEIKPKVSICSEALSGEAPVLGEEGSRETPVSGIPLRAAAGESVQIEEGGYVASKNGGKYHLPWCSGAQRIKEENKVWFKTKAEAEAAGYTPAANCKGL